MTLAHLSPADLALTLAPESLGFQDTSELVQQPLPWIGQERAETAARFGLAMEQPDYNLFVLGEVGSGRSSLLQQLMREVAATGRCRPTCATCTTSMRRKNPAPCACRPAREAAAPAHGANVQDPAKGDSAAAGRAGLQGRKRAP